jgi:hypothetical protein
MADWLVGLNETVSLIASSKAILGAGAGGLVILSGFGMVHRVGLGRALTLGLRSYFKTTKSLSVRKAEVQRLSESMLNMGRGSYIVVTGEAGYGKSCLIDTTLNNLCGVVKISVSMIIVACIGRMFVFFACLLQLVFCSPHPNSYLLIYYPR